MRSLSVLLLALLVSAAGAAPAQAQTLGTFRWQLQPFGAVVNLTVTARSGVYELIGYEEVCAGTLRRLPVTGVAVPQPDGRIMFGFTTINEAGRGVHTQAVIQLPSLSGFYTDNTGNTGQPFAFNPGLVCPLGPRTYPNLPDQPPAPNQP
jgi:hypothetical protein